jgi:hypothetical protein
MRRTPAKHHDAHRQARRGVCQAAVLPEARRGYPKRSRPIGLPPHTQLPSSPRLGMAEIPVCTFMNLCVLRIYFLRPPSRVPYRTPPAIAKMAAYPDPPPVVPVPESVDAQVAYQLNIV